MQTPPKWANQFFNWASGQAQNEDLLGDLHELFESKVEEKGKFIAQLHYWLEVLRLSFSYAITKRKRDGSISHYYSSQKFNTMLFNYIKISFRNIKKQKLFTFLNVFGLALGMSVGLLALAMVSDLRQFEHFHEDADQIYRITTEVTTSGNKRHYAYSPPALAEFIQSNNTSIIESAVINDAFFPTMEVMGESIQMNGYLTEPSFLNLFDFEVLYGTANAIDNPRSVIITYELAEKLFN